MAKHYEELTGEFDFIKRQYAQGEEQVKILPGILVDGTQVVGVVREDELECGLTYTFGGYWQESKYGKQFHFSSVRLAQPSGKRGTIEYLKRGPNIGTKRAIQIWNTFGPGALEAIREKPGEVAAAVKGLTTEMAESAAAYFKEHIALETTTKELLELLAGLGVPRNLIQKLIERYGMKAAENLRENPWLTMRFGGVGFNRADRLYLNLGKDPASKERMGWCAWNALHKDREGNTWRPMVFGVNSIRKGVTGANGTAETGIDWAIEEGNIVVKIDGGVVWIAEKVRVEAEVKLANQVHRAIMEAV
jgi:hypothetical protein